MSRWLHVNGCFKTVGSSIIKDGQDEIIPNLKEQAEVVKSWLTDPDSDKIIYDVHVYSLPRCKPIVDELIKELPTGEYECIEYSLSQNKQKTTYSSSEYLPSMHYFVNKKIAKLHKEKDKLVKFGWTHYCNGFSLAISDNVRDSDVDEFFTSFEAFYKKLLQNDIRFESGYLAFEDEYYGQYMFTIEATWDELILAVHDREDSKILAQRTLTYSYNMEKQHYELLENQTEGWTEFFK